MLDTREILSSRIPSTMLTQHPDNAKSPGEESSDCKIDSENLKQANKVEEKVEEHGKEIEKGSRLNIREILDEKTEKIEILKTILTKEEWLEYLSDTKKSARIKKIWDDDSSYKKIENNIPHDLGVEEIMIDYEGKLTPYILMEEIVSELIKCNHYPGIDCFITPRISASGEDKEPTYRQLMALTGIFAANNRAYRLYCDINKREHRKKEIKKIIPQSITEMILPMCSNIDELINIHERLKSIYDSLDDGYRKGSVLSNFRIIPLVEGITELLLIDNILRGYIQYLIATLGYKKVGERPIRIMLGRSDPAIFFGLVPAVLAAKLALRKCAKIEQDFGGRIQIAPILGVGSLPFRGHLSCDNFKNIFNEYPGIKTVTIQSALRYDYSIDEGKKVKEEIKKAKIYIRANPFRKIEDEKEDLEEFEQNVIVFIAKFAIEYWNDFVSYYYGEGGCEGISSLIPQRRRRMVPSVDHRRYERGLPEMARFFNFIAQRDLVKKIDAAFDEMKKRGEKEQFPRAIKFTAGFYSIGRPPELLGTLAALNQLEDSETLMLKKYYKYLYQDINFALRYTDREIIEKFKKEYTELFSGEDIVVPKEDVNYSRRLKFIINEYMQEKSSVNKEDTAKQYITEMGQIRKSLG